MVRRRTRGEWIPTGVAFGRNLRSWRNWCWGDGIFGALGSLPLIIIGILVPGFAGLRFLGFLVPKQPLAKRGPRWRPGSVNVSPSHPGPPPEHRRRSPSPSASRPAAPGVTSVPPSEGSVVSTGVSSLKGTGLGAGGGKVKSHSGVTDPAADGADELAPDAAVNRNRASVAGRGRRFARCQA